MQETLIRVSIHKGPLIILPLGDPKVSHVLPKWSARMRNMAVREMLRRIDPESVANVHQ